MVIRYGQCTRERWSAVDLDCRILFGSDDLVRPESQLGNDRRRCGGVPEQPGRVEQADAIGKAERNASVGQRSKVSRGLRDSLLHAVQPVLPGLYVERCESSSCAPPELSAVHQNAPS